MCSLSYLIASMFVNSTAAQELAINESSNCVLRTCKFAKNCIIIVSEYDQEITQSQTADKPMAPGVS